jgi:hypothetical protein
MNADKKRPTTWSFLPLFNLRPSASSADDAVSAFLPLPFSLLSCPPRNPTIPPPPPLGMPIWQASPSLLRYPVTSSPSHPVTPFVTPYFTWMQKRDLQQFRFSKTGVIHNFSRCKNVSKTRVKVTKTYRKRTETIRNEKKQGCFPLPSLTFWGSNPSGASARAVLTFPKGQKSAFSALKKSYSQFPAIQETHVSGFTNAERETRNAELGTFKLGTRNPERGAKNER